MSAPNIIYAHGGAMTEVLLAADRVAATNARVLITGETGVGKELWAQRIHAASARRARTMHVVNCAGVPESILQSEMFGHVKGSFTGAIQDRSGKIEVAH